MDGRDRAGGGLRLLGPAARARRGVPGDGVLDVVLHQPQRGVAAGQAVVLYDGDTVLGSATIAGMPGPEPGNKGA